MDDRTSNAMIARTAPAYALALGALIYAWSVSNDVAKNDRAAIAAIQDAQNEAAQAKKAAREAQATADEALAKTRRVSSPINDYDRVKLRDCETDYFGEKSCKLVK